MALETPNAIVAALNANWDESRPLGGRYKLNASAGFAKFWQTQTEAFNLYGELLEPVRSQESAVLVKPNPLGGSGFDAFIVEKPNTDPVLQALPDNTLVLACNLANFPTNVGVVVFGIPATT